MDKSQAIVAQSQQGVHRDAAASLGGNKSRLIRDRHRAMCLQALRGRQMSRAALAEALGVTRAAAAQIVDSLITDGYLAEMGSRGARGRQGGRPGIAVGLSGRGPIVMGIEIGHDRLRACAMDLTGSIVARDEVRVPDGQKIAGGDFDLVADLAMRTASALLDSVQVAGPLARVAIAVPGFTDRLGRLVAAPLLGWEDVPLSRLVGDRFGVPVSVSNDANVCAFGEAHHLEGGATAAEGDADASRGPAEVLFILLETGVGGGYVVGGDFLAGAQGLGCEIGHIGGRGAVPGSPHQSSLEQRFGKRQLVQRAVASLGAPVDLETLLARAAAGEETVRRFARHEGLALCEVIADLVYLLNPARIVLGGEMARLFAPVLEEMADALDALLLPRFPRPELAAARDGSWAAAIGAATYAHALLAAHPPSRS